MAGSQAAVNACLFANNGKVAISGGDDKFIRVWDTLSGKQLYHPTQGHSGPVTALAVSACGTMVVSGAKDNTVRVWQLANGKQVKKELHVT